jgi:hypothetical protein
MIRNTDCSGLRSVQLRAWPLHGLARDAYVKVVSIVYGNTVWEEGVRIAQEAVRAKLTRQAHSRRSRRQ